MASICNIPYLQLGHIGPNDDNYYDKHNPSKIVLIGKPGTGKSCVINAILYHMCTKINNGIIICGTEDVNQAYVQHFPTLFIYNEYSETPIRNLIAAQKAKIRAGVKNPWAILIVDDCAYDKSFFKSSLQNELFKNSRHWYILYILALQYCRDIPPSIRAAIDGTFIFREHNHAVRKTIYENYASVIPTFGYFEQLMDNLTKNHGTLFIDNMTSTDDWTDTVYQYRAPIIVDQWYFGGYDFWEYSNKKCKK